LVKLLCEVSRASRQESGCADDAAPLVSRRACNGCLPLHYSAIHGHVDTTETLVQLMRQNSNCVYSSLANKYGKTPKDLAAKRGHYILVQYLRDAEMTLMMPASVDGVGRLPHVKARTQPSMSRDSPFQPYPQRVHVPSHKVQWSIAWAAYEPPHYLDPHVQASDRTLLDGGFADPEDPSLLRPSMWAQRSSCEGPIQMHRLDTFTVWPRNPRGRTGLAGRGALGLWGPNRKVYMIVTRRLDDDQDDLGGGGQLEVLVRLAPDKKTACRLPGGFEKPDYARRFPTSFGRAVRQIAKSTWFPAGPADDEEVLLGTMLGLECYGTTFQGYVDDARNTDNAWVEAMVTQYHLSPQDGESHVASHWADNLDRYRQLHGFRWIRASPSHPDHADLLPAEHTRWVNDAEMHMMSAFQG